MTTRQASLATGRSLIFEIAVTTVLFRPVSLTRLDPNRNRADQCSVSAHSSLSSAARLHEQRVDDLVAAAHEAVRLQQQPAAV